MPPRKKGRAPTKFKYETQDVLEDNDSEPTGTQNPEGAANADGDDVDQRNENAPHSAQPAAGANTSPDKRQTRRQAPEAADASPGRQKPVNPPVAPPPKFNARAVLFSRSNEAAVAREYADGLDDEQDALEDIDDVEGEAAAAQKPEDASPSAAAVSSPSKVPVPAAARFKRRRRGQRGAGADADQIGEQDDEAARAKLARTVADPTSTTAYARAPSATATAPAPSPASAAAATPTRGRAASGAAADVSPAKHRELTQDLARYMGTADVCVLCASGKHLRVSAEAVVHTSIGPGVPADTQDKIKTFKRNGHEVAMWCCPAVAPGRAPMFTALWSESGVLTQRIERQQYHVMPLIDLSRCHLCAAHEKCTLLTRLPEAGEAGGLGVPFPPAAAPPEGVPTPLAAAPPVVQSSDAAPPGLQSGSTAVKAGPAGGVRIAATPEVSAGRGRRKGSDRQATVADLTGGEAPSPPPQPTQRQLDLPDSPPALPDASPPRAPASAAAASAGGDRRARTAAARASLSRELKALLRKPPRNGSPAAVRVSPDSATGTPARLANSGHRASPRSPPMSTAAAQALPLANGQLATPEGERAAQAAEAARVLERLIASRPFLAAAVHAVPELRVKWCSDASFRRGGVEAICAAACVITGTHHEYMRFVSRDTSR